MVSKDKPGVVKRKKAATVPPLVQSTRDWVQNSSGGDGSTDVKQISEAVTPSFANPFIELLVKGRVDPSIDGDIALLLSEAYHDGELNLSELGLEDASIATAFVTVKQMNSYAINGKAREELVSVLSSSMGRIMGRARGMFRRGGGNYEGGGGFGDGNG